MGHMPLAKLLTHNLCLSPSRTAVPTCVFANQAESKNMIVTNTRITLTSAKTTWPLGLTEAHTVLAVLFGRFQR